MVGKRKRMFEKPKKKEKNIFPYLSMNDLEILTENRISQNGMVFHPSYYEKKLRRGKKISLLEAIKQKPVYNTVKVPLFDCDNPQKREEWSNFINQKQKIHPVTQIIPPLNMNPYLKQFNSSFINPNMMIPKPYVLRQKEENKEQNVIKNYLNIEENRNLDVDFDLLRRKEKSELISNYPKNVVVSNFNGFENLAKHQYPQNRMNPEENFTKRPNRIFQKSSEENNLQKMNSKSLKDLYHEARAKQMNQIFQNKEEK